ncbi:MAG: ATPase domain protein, partial [Candidatus Berkelbacteria bacterium]|nr:ATPase domain protein [Candidatus Berkelbacteria bacterium]
MNDPKDIFKKFSQNSRKALISSQKIAQNSSAALNSRHILLALAITPGTLAYSILQEHMISLDQIRLVISLQRDTQVTQKNGISSEAKQVIQQSAQIAKDLNHTQIDPEHLLMAIVSNPKSLGCEIISRIGADPQLIKKELNNIFLDIKELEQKPLQPPRMQIEFPEIPPTSQDGRPEEMQDLPLMGEMPMHPSSMAGGPPQKNILDYFTTDLTRQARENKIDPLVGRKNEIQRVIHILARRTKNNPVLVGEPGVGKTAIVEGLAQMIDQGNVPNQLLDKKIIML